MTSYNTQQVIMLVTVHSSTQLQVSSWFSVRVTRSQRQSTGKWSLPGSLEWKWSPRWTACSQSPCRLHSESQRGTRRALQWPAMKTWQNIVSLTTEGTACSRTTMEPPTKNSHSASKLESKVPQILVNSPQPCQKNTKLPLWSPHQFILFFKNTHVSFLCSLLNAHPVLKSDHLGVWDLMTN